METNCLMSWVQPRNKPNKAIRLNWTKSAADSLLIGWPPHAADKPQPLFCSINLCSAALIPCHHPADAWHRLQLAWCKVLLTGRALTTRAHLWPLWETGPHPTHPTTLPLPFAFIHSLLATQVHWGWSPKQQLSRSCLLPGDVCVS